MGAGMAGFLDFDEKQVNDQVASNLDVLWRWGWQWCRLTCWELTTCLRYSSSLHVSTPVISETAVEGKCCYYLYFKLEERERLSRLLEFTQLPAKALDHLSIASLLSWTAVSFLKNYSVHFKAKKTFLTTNSLTTRSLWQNPWNPRSFLIIGFCLCFVLVFSYLCIMWHFWTLLS